MLAKRLLALFHAPYLVYVAAHDTVIISKYVLDTCIYTYILTKRPLAPFHALYLLYIAPLDKGMMSMHLSWMHTYIYVCAHKAATRALPCTIPRICCRPRRGNYVNAVVDAYVYMCMLTKRPLAPMHVLYLVCVAALDKGTTLMHMYWIHTYTYMPSMYRIHTYTYIPRTRGARAYCCTIPRTCCRPRHGTH